MPLRAAAFAVSVAALALTGCLSSANEPFPLDGGDQIATQPGDFACRTFDEHGAAKAETARLVRLRRDQRTQYVFLAPDNSSAGPVTLHRVKNGVYVVAVAHEEGPGEDLYLAAPDAAGFRLYAPAPAALTKAAALSAGSGATIAHTQFSDDLTGPVAAQRAFALAFAADLRNWRQTVDCRAKRR